MKKTTYILAIIMTLIIGSALAEEINIPKLVNINEQSAQSTVPTFAFISGVSGQPRVGSLHLFTTPGYIPATMGGACSLDQFVVAYQCEYSTGTNCQRMLRDDWKITYAGELLPYSNWKNEQWFKDVLVYKKYSAYECLAAKTTPTTETAIYGKPDGVFTKITWPKSPVSDSTYVTINGQYKVTQEGYFLLEAGILSQATTTFAIVSASKSSCDASGFFAGKRLYGKAGEIYDFSFKVRVPEPPEGKTSYYTMIAHAWTDCYDPKYSSSGKSGEQITAKTATLQVKNTWTTASLCGTTDTDGDGVYDKCDICPKDYGSKDNHGCHPCAFLSLDLQSTKDCYYANQDKYEIPIIVLDYIDPYVKTITECRNSNTQVATVSIRQSGLRSTVSGSTITCQSPETCVQATKEAASCKTPQPPETPKPTKVGEEALCEGENKVIYEMMSDGNNIKKGTFPCSYGCSNGACLQGPDTSPDPDAKGVDGVKPQVKDCETSAECSAGYYCLSNKCAPTAPSMCITDADCQPPQTICDPSIKTCVSVPSSECNQDSDCTPLNAKFNYCINGCQCISELCVPKETIINTSTTLQESCTQNEIMTCSDGSSVITGACSEEGKLFPTGRNCLVEEDGLPIIKTKITDVITIPGTNKKINWVIVVVTIGVLVAGIYYYKTQFGKKKGKRKR